MKLRPRLLLRLLLTGLLLWLGMKLRPRLLLHLLLARLRTWLLTRRLLHGLRMIFLTRLLLRLDFRWTRHLLLRLTLHLRLRLRLWLRMKPLLARLLLLLLRGRVFRGMRRAVLLLRRLRQSSLWLSAGL